LNKEYSIEKVGVQSNWDNILQKRAVRSSLSM